MAAEPLVARAQPQDLEEVVALTRAAYVGTYVAPGDAYAAQLDAAADRATQAELWVARLAADAPVVGSVTFCPPGSGMREVARADEGEFRMLAVAPDARGRGVGEALVRHCLRRCQELGLAGVRLCTMPQMDAAQRIYARLGFTRAPEDDWSPVPGVELLGYAVRLRR